MKISVAIPTVGRDSIKATLRTLERQTYRPFEVLVINQGRPAPKEWLDFDLPLRILNQSERGVARARSCALDSFSGDWVLFTDDDQEVNAEWCEQLVKLIESYPGATFFGGSVFPPPIYDKATEFVSQLYIPGEIVLDESTYLRPFDTSGMLADLWGGNYALSRTCVDAVGTYDEFLGRGSGFCEAGEDTDFAMRAITKGFTGILSCRLIVYHTYGVRPIEENSGEEPIEVAALLAWKARRDPANVSPILASRLQAYGRKKAVLARVTGGKLYGGEAQRESVYLNMTARLDSGYRVVDGRIVPGTVG